MKRSQRPRAYLVASCILLLAPLMAQSEQEKPSVVKDGKTISIEYTLKSSDGDVLDTNVGGEPLQYIHGESQIVPGLEKALTGVPVGDSKHVEITPEDGYGPVRAELMKEVPIEQVPEDGRHVGAQLVVQGEGGQQQPVRVAEVGESTLVVDFNHPLAGQELVFDIKVLAVK